MGAVIVLLAWTLLPGLGLGLLLTRWGRSDASSDALLVRATSSALVVWTIGSMFLARTVGIGRASAAVVAAIAAVVGLWLVFRFREDLWAQAGSIARGCAAVATGVMAFLPVLWTSLRSMDGPVGPTPWYYWGLARQVAESGQFPRTSVEWGVQVPFLADYQAFSAATATLITQSDGVLPVHLVTLAAMVSTSIGIYALSVACGASFRAALLAPPLMVGILVFATKLSSYRPESFAYGVGLLLVANAIDWLRHRDRGALLAAALLSGVLTQVHLIVAGTAGLLLVVVALAQCAVLRSLQPARSMLRLGAAGGVSVAAVFLLFGRSATSVNLSRSAVGGHDPTWEFHLAIRGRPYVEPPGTLDVLRTTISGFTAGPGWVYWGFVVLAILGIAALALRGSKASRFVLLITFGFILCQLVVSTVFLTGWDTYVPRRTGAHRTLQLTPILVPVLVAVLMSESGLLRRGRIATAIVGATVCVVFAANISFSHEIEAMRPESAVVRALSSARVPSDAVILASGYTEGFIEVTTGATGLLDGRAPYTFGRLLVRANRLLTDGRMFFADPVHHREFLREHGVTHVLVAPSHGWALGTSNRLPVDFDAFRSLPWLEQLLVVDGVTLFRVIP